MRFPYSTSSVRPGELSRSLALVLGSNHGHPTDFENVHRKRIKPRHVSFALIEIANLIDNGIAQRCAYRALHVVDAKSSRDFQMFIMICCRHCESPLSAAPRTSNSNGAAAR